MSSLPRTRSLRKPTTNPPSADPSRHTTNSSSSRSISPSRLPFKPAATAATAASSARPRPKSVHGPSTIASTTGGASTGTARNPRPASTLISRSVSLSKKQHGPGPVAAQDPVKKESRYQPFGSARKPSSSGAKTRPTSAGSGSVPPVQGSPPARGIPVRHARAKSTVTSLSAASAAATGLQPLLRERSVSSKLTHKRSFSASKVPSTPVGKQQQQQQQQQQHQQQQKQGQSSTTAAAPAQAAPKPRLRPAFSTLQQHYSPAKAQGPKPLTSAILAPPSPSKLPANIAASAETSRLQAELLQLHLLHQDARTVHAQWQASAEDKLGSRFRRLCQASAAVAEREASVLEGENMLALRQWARGGGQGKNIEDKIQVLDEVVTNLWMLSDPAGGRYTRLVRRFERFLDRVRDAEAARRQSLEEEQHEDHHHHHQHHHPALATPGPPLDMLFVDELDASWRDEVAALTRRLETWTAQFSSIDDFAAGDTTPLADADGTGGSASALGRMLAGVRHLLREMLRELYAMGEMEALALAREEAWIERMNREGEDGEGTTNRGVGAVWRVL
ncbi:hypothetical protein E4U55_002590 [Claviceps digitariae]|nr:hypothetical protein E4U55_002590 [Claviceps digitariae]